MKKIFVFALIGVVLFAVGVFAAGEITTTGTQAQAVGAEVSGFVDSFVSKRGIDENSINNITQVDFNSLPKEVNIKNVGDNNLAIYQVNYADQGKDKNVFVVTYSVDKLVSQGDLIVAHDKRQFLNFGLPGNHIGSQFLETGAGVGTSLEKGYVMPRDGSITAVSTNIDVTQASVGSIQIVVYKNGQPINFGNTFTTEAVGVAKDYDVQSSETVTFNAGDVISVYASSPGNAAWSDAITMVEITTLN